MEESTAPAIDRRDRSRRAGARSEGGGDHSMTPFMEVKGVRKQYGSIKAVDGVSFNVGTC